MATPGFLAETLKNLNYSYLIGIAKTKPYQMFNGMQHQWYRMLSLKYDASSCNILSLPICHKCMHSCSIIEPPCAWIIIFQAFKLIPSHGPSEFSSESRDSVHMLKYTAILYLDIGGQSDASNYPLVLWARERLRWNLCENFLVQSTCNKIIWFLTFQNASVYKVQLNHFGCSSSVFEEPYLALAAAVGMEEFEIDKLISKLTDIFGKIKMEKWYLLDYALNFA